MAGITLKRPVLSLFLSKLHYTILKLRVVIAIVVCILSQRVLGRDTGAYSFLDITSSSRIYGLGGVNISSISEDINSVTQNPSLLGPEYDHSVGFNYMRYIGSSNFAGLVYGTAIGTNSAWGVALNYFGYGAIDETDITGATLGSFSPKDIVISGLYSRDINDYLRGGAAIKTIYSSYSSFSAVAIAADLGLNYYVEDRDMSLSLTAVNLGGQVKRFDSSYESLPIDVRLGWTKGLGNSPFSVSLTAWHLTSWRVRPFDADNDFVDTEGNFNAPFFKTLMSHIVVGIDVQPTDRIYICAGYNYHTRLMMSSYRRNLLSGLSIGTGINTGGFGVGVSLAQPHNGALTLMLNLSADLSYFLK